MELRNKIICGSAEEVPKTFPAESINCSISSPPYWGLRDYGVGGQLGLEKTFEEYIDKLCDIYDEVWRVLRKDGTCWVNLGTTFQDKCDCLIPERFAIEMVNRGWIKRRTIIWHKPSPMPSSVKDDFTLDFEYVFFFVKSKKYWFEPQYEPQSQSTINHAPRKPRTLKGEQEEKVKPTFGSINELPLGRNKRCVWTIPTQACPDAHFATFPDKLVEPMIKAGCPEFVCKKCGKARVKIIDTTYENAGGKGNEKYGDNVPNNGSNPGPQGMKYGRANAVRVPIGYTDCGCNAGFKPGIMLDPFCGTATACKVAASLGRDYIGIDLNEKYVKNFALPNVQAADTGVPVAEQRAGQMGLFKGGGKNINKNDNL